MQESVKAEDLAYVRAMVIRVQDNPNDLQYKEFSPKHCAAISALAKNANLDFCHTSAFKKIYAIALIKIKGAISIFSEETLQGVLWYLAQKEMTSLVVLDLSNEKYFSQLIHRSVRFWDLQVSATALINARVSHPDMANIGYSAKKNSFTIDFGCPISEIEGFGELFKWSDLEKWIYTSPNRIMLGFSSLTFSLAEIERLIHFSQEKLTAVYFRDSCQFSPQAKDYLFQSLQAGICTQDKINLPKHLQEEYVQYCEVRMQLNIVKTLIGKYKNNTLSHAELKNVNIKNAICHFHHQPVQELDPECLAALYHIVRFPLANSQIEISTEEMFKAAQWFLMHTSSLTSWMCVSNPEYAKRLLKAYEQNTADDKSANIQLTVNDACSVKLICSNDHVRIDVNGRHKNAEVLREVLNAISSPVIIRLNNLNLVTLSDLSNPLIRKVELVNSKKREITAEHVRILSQTQNLTSFYAKGCKFASPDVKASFVDAILANPNLTSLHLKDCDLTGTQIAKIQAYSEKHPHLIEIDLSENAFRSGEDDALNNSVRINKDRLKARQEREEDRAEMLQGLQTMSEKGLQAFHNYMQLISPSIAIEPVYRDRRFIAGYVDILSAATKRMSFFSEKFIDEMEALLSLLTDPISLSDARQKKIMDSLIAVAGTHSELSPSAVVLLIKYGYVSEALFAIQQTRFNRELQSFKNAMIIATKVASIERLQTLACLNSPEELFEQLYVAYLDLADFACSRPTLQREEGATIFNYLTSIPRGSKNYTVAEEKVKQLLLAIIKGILNVDIKSEIKGILNSDIQTEEATKFQKAFLLYLSEKITRGKMTLQELLVAMRNFINEASMLPFREKYITNKNMKVAEMEKLYGLLQTYVSSLGPVPSAPPKEQDDIQQYAKDAVKKEAEHQMYPALDALPNNISGVSAAPPVFIPDAPQSMPQYQSPPAVATTPTAPPLSNERVEVNVVAEPVPYAQPLSDAHLMSGQRNAEAAPVLQGVAAAPANIWPAVPTHPAGQSEQSVQEVPQTAPQKNSVPRRTALMDG